MVNVATAIPHTATFASHLMNANKNTTAAAVTLKNCEHGCALGCDDGCGYDEGYGYDYGYDCEYKSGHACDWYGTSNNEQWT